MQPVELLMLALRPETTADAWFGCLAQGAVDEDELVVAAIALGLAPLLHYRLQGWGRALGRPRAQAKLDFVRQAEQARHTSRQAQLVEILSRLPRPPIVLKGAFLAEKVYPAAGLRPMNDIDLLFQPNEMGAVAHVLHALGYGSKDKSPEVGPGITKHTSTFKREGQAATPNPYLSADSSRMIEPHHSLEEAWFGLRCDLTPGMRERSVPTRIAGEAARVLAPADALLHLCVHLTFHLIMRSPSLVQLADLEVYVEQVRVDWQDFLARAKELRAAGYAYAAARLASQVLAAPFPAEVLDALRTSSPRSVRRAADTLSLADVMRRTQVPPLRSIRQRLARGVADRHETARWAQSPAEWLRVWWTLVDVRRTDTWRLIAARGR